MMVSLFVLLVVLVQLCTYCDGVLQTLRIKVRENSRSSMSSMSSSSSNKSTKKKKKTNDDDDDDHISQSFFLRTSRLLYDDYISQSFFGPIPSMNVVDDIYTYDDMILTLPPKDNPFMCNNVSSTSTTSGRDIQYYTMTKTVYLIPRGECTFERKVYNAQRLFQANAVFIYGTLASRYSINKTSTTTNDNDQEKQYTVDDIIFPTELYDYDCGASSSSSSSSDSSSSSSSNTADVVGSRAYIPSNQIVLDDPVPYNSDRNDILLSGDDTEENLCIQYSSDHLHNCASKSCLLTGNMKIMNNNNEQANVTTITSSALLSSSSSANNNNNNSPLLEACCAWDLSIWLYPDYTIDQDHIVIPSAYLTMEQGKRLLDAYNQRQQKNDRDDDQGYITITLTSRWRPSFNISAILIWMLGVFVAAIASYLTASDYNDYIRSITPADMKNGKHTNHNNSTQQQQLTSSSDGGSSSSGGGGGKVIATQQQQQQQQRPILIQDEIVELTVYHAIGFIFVASSSLLILFYLKIYNLVKIFYTIGCSTAVSQILFQPLVVKIMKRLHIRDIIVIQSFTDDIVDIGDITMFHIISYMLGYSLGIVWISIALYVHNPEHIFFFWITQNIFGSCMCILFMKMIRLNSIRVASLLLIIAFLYDIFFVFISPLLFSGKSVMITVATSGGPPIADALYCEKYPNDKDCQGGNPLPMLLTIPRLFDYQGGSSLLGLGDIVLPGLLLSFGARYDAAKSLLGILGGGKDGICRRGGYFIPLVVSYGVGLLMANMAVYIMNMGQPALLYLVPCCLGTITYLGYRRHELTDLWDGPKILHTADDVVYGTMEEEEDVVVDDNEDNNDNDDNNHQPNGNNNNNSTSSSSSRQNHHHAPLPTDERNQRNAPTVPSAAS